MRGVSSTPSLSLRCCRCWGVKCPGSVAACTMHHATSSQYQSAALTVLAGALRDNGRAVIIGQRTFGKGVVQWFFPLDPPTALPTSTQPAVVPSTNDPTITTDQAVGQIGARESRMAEGPADDAGASGDQGEERLMASQGALASSTVSTKSAVQLGNSSVGVGVGGSGGSQDAGLQREGGLGQSGGNRPALPAVDVEPGGGLRITVAKWLTPSGWDITRQGGLVPDLVCDAHPAAFGDPVDACIEAALAWIRAEQDQGHG
ncbi:PDZ domain-containing protein [Haematococcus lacustris]|uniref:PDZ domain-containing protein n=1 Tax=Haematococcus lacustris TaxID=44745 RepID=A0A699YXV5_HAELA|nr:PDZ domain-containing protein [Haematococcus lacustris]